MTARELIEELSKLPPEAQVRVGHIDDYEDVLIHDGIKRIECYNALGEIYINLYADD